MVGDPDVCRSNNLADIERFEVGSGTHGRPREDRIDQLQLVDDEIKERGCARRLFQQVRECAQRGSQTPFYLFMHEDIFRAVTH